MVNVEVKSSNRFKNSEFVQLAHLFLVFFGISVYLEEDLRVGLFTTGRRFGFFLVVDGRSWIAERLVAIAGGLDSRKIVRNRPVHS